MLLEHVVLIMFLKQNFGYRVIGKEGGAPTSSVLRANPLSAHPTVTNQCDADVSAFPP